MNKTYGKALLVTSFAALNTIGVYLYKKDRLILADDSLIIKNIECDKHIIRYKEEYGVPGIVVGVSKNGKCIYSKGFGYSDVENNVRADSNTVMRIASISKPITATIAAKLCQDSKLDLDNPINNYLTDLEPFKWNNTHVKITSKQLLNHTSGIRHYKDHQSHINESEILEVLKDDKSDSKAKAKKIIEKIRHRNNSEEGDAAFAEFFLNKPFKTTKEALNIFINDELNHEPGSKFLYTTFGYTMLSAVIEKASGDVPFSKLLIELFKIFDMNETYLDQNDPLIPFRSKYYMRNKNKKLVNVPHVDNSYKWAGGGILSNVNDLLKFANSLLKFYQSKEEDNFLKSSTIKSLLWSIDSHLEYKDNNTKYLTDKRDKKYYGLGWVICVDENKDLKYVYHTGGAVGASSCLLIIPSKNSSNSKAPEGLVVAVLCNSQNVGEIVKFTTKIASYFAETD